MEGARRRILVIILLVGMVFAPVGEAGEAGDIQATNDDVSHFPASPNEGGDVRIDVQLHNSGTSDIDGVRVKFYDMNEYPNTFFAISSQLTIPLAGLKVSGTWSNAPAGTQTVVVLVENNGSSFSLEHEFTITSLPNLKISALTVTHDGDAIHTDDQIFIEATILNEGGANSTETTLMISLDEQEEFITIPAIETGGEVTVNDTLTAPAAGTWDLFAQVNPDLDPLESDWSDNVDTQQVVVAAAPDYFHDGAILVEVSEFALEGPWLLSGVIGRAGTHPQTEMDMLVMLGDNLIKMKHFIFPAGTDSNIEWSITILPSSLDEDRISGTHQLTLKLVPSAGDDPNPFNDEGMANITIHETPDLVVASDALASSATIGPNSPATWEVVLTNEGTIPVKGNLSISWNGVNDENIFLTLQPREVNIQHLERFSGSELGQYHFWAEWLPDAESSDSSTANNIAHGTLTVANFTEELELTFKTETQSLSPNLIPLHRDLTYTYSINLDTTGEGNETILCMDAGNSVELDREEIVATSDILIVSVECTFMIPSDWKGSRLTLSLVAQNGKASSHMTAFMVVPIGESGGGSSGVVGGYSTTAVATVLVSLGLFFIIVLISAWYLTKEREVEVERGIYDYCPHCDGELEENEVKCPHCGADISKAGEKFHACEECSEMIPTMLDACPFCGTAQYLESHYERREKKAVAPMPKPAPATTAEPDDDTIVVGNESEFSQTISEYGLSDEKLEEEWETELDAAEKELDAVMAKREELELMEDTDEQTVNLISKITDIEDGDIDDFLQDKSERRHVVDEDVKYSASDAEIREEMFDITGSEGVLPGEKVYFDERELEGEFEGEMSDPTHDFSLNGPSDEVVNLTKKGSNGRRRAVRRKKEDPIPQPEQPAPSDLGPIREMQIGECGRCGGKVDVSASECHICGARFE